MTRRSDRCLKILTEVGAQDWGLEVTNLDHSPAEWTITTRDNGAGAGMEVYSLALDLDDRSAKVGSVDSPTSGATWTPAVSLGFTTSLGFSTSFGVSGTGFSIPTGAGDLGS